MKIAYILLLYFLLPIFSIAQNDVTRFLGIPVDGSKTEMINKLKSKGFNIDSQSEFDNELIGEFNGKKVKIHIVTNKNKVWRIMVSDLNYTQGKDEYSIINDFNNLIMQFQYNKNYHSLSEIELNNHIIQNNENLLSEILVNKKKYEVLFYQKSLDANSEKYDSLMRIYKNREVWFSIYEFRNKLHIKLCYDNVYNMPTGEDL